VEAVEAVEAEEAGAKAEALLLLLGNLNLLLMSPAM